MAYVGLEDTMLCGMSQVRKGNYEKELRGQIKSVNNATVGVMMLDMTDDCWEIIKNSSVGVSAEKLGIEQTYYHYNVLMDDLSVDNPTDKDAEMNPYLWASDKWAGVW